MCSWSHVGHNVQRLSVLLLIHLSFLFFSACDDAESDCEALQKETRITFTQVTLQNESSDSTCPDLNTDVLNQQEDNTTMTTSNCTIMSSEGLKDQCSVIQTCDLVSEDGSILAYDTTLETSENNQFSGTLEIGTADLLCQYTVEGTIDSDSVMK